MSTEDGVEEASSIKKASTSTATAAPATTSTTTAPKSDLASLLSKEKLDQLAKSVDPNLKLDEDVQEFLQQFAGELVDEIATMATKLAQARKSKVLEVQDVKYYLEHNWNMFIPGFGADSIKAKRKVPETEAHKNRQAIIKKHLKKFWSDLNWLIVWLKEFVSVDCNGPLVNWLLD